MRELVMSYSGHGTIPSRVPHFSEGKGSPKREREGLSALDTLGSVCRFRRGEMIFGEGDEVRSSYKIVSGAVRLSRITEDGRRQIVEFRTAGEFVGFEW